jgi:hypothetical protein
MHISRHLKGFSANADLDVRLHALHQSEARCRAGLRPAFTDKTLI